MFMQLLDATLAFALTMAALATVVTVIMEACLRIARMRKKNFIEVMKLLNKELGKGTLGMDDDERWEFFVRVVENPAEPTIEKLKAEWKDLPLEERLAFFGRDKAAKTGGTQRIFNFILQLFGDKKRTGLYENVSLEYMLRCLSETESVKKASREESETLKVEFNRIARKYEEFSSSVSASFKHHAQAWSIGIGIILAMVANIDGLRIFEAYRVDPSLATAVIKHQEEFTQNHQEAQKTIKKFNEIQAKVEAVKKELDQAEAAKDESKINLKKQALAEAKAALEEQMAIKNIQQTAQRAQQQLADLVALGVPLGWKLYPGCPYGGTAEEWGMSSPKCKAIPAGKRKKIVNFDGFDARVANTALNDLAGFALWLLVVVMTGVLIGLGAPFWFDVAKRLAQIRKGLQSATASTEYRLSARDANGNYKKRKEIVENVLEDAAGEAAAMIAEIPKGRTLLSSDGTAYMKGR
jgi:hypothetical protein